MSVPMHRTWVAHDPHRCVGSNARRNYAATSPITRASDKKKVVAARLTHDDRLIDTLMSQAFSARENIVQDD
jgi:hypothetical protein